MERHAKIILADAYKLALGMRQSTGNKGYLARTICNRINTRFPYITKYVEENDGQKKATEQKNTSSP